MSGYYTEVEHDKRTVIEPAVNYVNKHRESEDDGRNQNKTSPRSQISKIKSQETVPS